MQSNLQAVTAGGTRLDAKFSVEATRDGFDVVLDSRSGGKKGGDNRSNPDYEKLFTLILQRAEAAGATLADALVVSSHTEHLDEADRRLRPADMTFPLNLQLVDDLDQLRIRLSRMQGAIGRRPNARGPGNRNKRVRLRFLLPGSATEQSLGRLLTAGKTPERRAARGSSGTPQMVALENVRETSQAHAQFERLFAEGAQKLPALSGTALWHEDLGTWGVFGASIRRDGSSRRWNPFGQVPSDFRSQIIVEINPPVSGQDVDLQGVFARDERGDRWLLHQGRMSISGKRITQSDFRTLSGLRPVRVTFKNGSSRLFHPVANLEQPPRVVQAAVARFVAVCAEVRQASRSSDQVRRSVSEALSWEALLSPERTGEYDTKARAAGKAEHRHGRVWKRLVAELTKRNVEISNSRVGQYGPDLYTVRSPLVLFEIKSDARAADLFEGVGQLQIYEQLMGASYRKVLVVPAGASAALKQVLPAMHIEFLQYERKGGTITFDGKDLAATLRSCRKSG